MGHELFRMIRDGAPPSWTPAMRLVAGVIADDALDPSQELPGDGGWPRSAIRVRGGHSRGRGREWYDGITERTGMSERAISRALTALARAGYEMREQVGTDQRGRPVFAYPGRTPRFRVPSLTPRGSPPSTATIEARQVRRPSEARRVRRPRKVAKYGDHGSPPDLASKVAEFGELPTPLPNPLSPDDTHLQVVNSSLEGSRDRQGDDDFEAERHQQQDLPAPAPERRPKRFHVPRTGVPEAEWECRECGRMAAEGVRFAEPPDLCADCAAKAGAGP